MGARLCMTGSLRCVAQPAPCTTLSLMLKFCSPSSPGSSSSVLETALFAAAKLKPSFCKMDFVIGDLAGFHGHTGFFNGTFGGQEALKLKPAHPFHDLPAYWITSWMCDHDTLNSPGTFLAQLNKGHRCTLHSRTLDPRPHLSSLADSVFPNIFQALQGSCNLRWRVKNPNIYLLQDLRLRKST